MPDHKLQRAMWGTTLYSWRSSTVLRVSAAGASLIDRWFVGERPHWENPTQRQLADRLIDTGLAHEQIEPPPAHTDLSSSLTIVIPVHDDQAGLARTLKALFGTLKPNVSKPSTIVIDDCSEIPIEPVIVGEARLLRLRNQAGPGGARQQSLPHIKTSHVCFVDAGVELSLDDVSHLLAYCQLTDTAAVAPRVRSTAAATEVGIYEQDSSPLDLGPVPAVVSPGSHVSYVPTAALLVTTASLHAVGGFDVTLRYGEDVDLVWRLSRHGKVRFVPDVVAYHRPRPSISAMMRQRYGYGSAVAPLYERHGPNVAPLRLTPAMLATGLMIAIGLPRLALATVAAAAVAIRRSVVSIPDPTTFAMRIAAKTYSSALAGIATSVARVWWPALVAIATFSPSLRAKIATVIGVSFCRRLVRRPLSLDRMLRDTTIGALDDIAYSAGAWRSVFRTRSARSLLPSVIAGKKNRPNQK